MSQFAVDPSVPTHAHDNGRCPIFDASPSSSSSSSTPASTPSGSCPHAHAYCPPQPGDKRSPCPAMNTLANHGYLPRDGKGITSAHLIAGLTQGLGLSKPLAYFFGYGTFIMMRQGWDPLQLSDLARHDRIEHNASFYHRDVPKGGREEYAPTTIDEEMLEDMLSEAKVRGAKDGGDVSASGVLLPEDVGRVRVRRQWTADPPMKENAAAFANVDAAVAFLVFNNPDPERAQRGAPLQQKSLSLVERVFGWIVPSRKQILDPSTTPLDGIPLDRAEKWFKTEKLPEDWRPYHTTGLWVTVKMIWRMRQAMKQLEKDSKSKKTD